MGRISDVVYFFALLLLTVHFGVDFELAYPMLADYDPMGLSIIVPVLCVAALFGGVHYGLSKDYGDQFEWLRWVVMIAFPVYAAFRLSQYLEKAYTPNGWIIAAHFACPALLWVVQIWSWRRAEAGGR